MTEDDGWRLVDKLLALIADPSAAQQRRDEIKADAEAAQKLLDAATDMQAQAAEAQAAADKAMQGATLKFGVAETKFKEAEEYDARNGAKADELARREGDLNVSESNAKHLWDRIAETQNDNDHRQKAMDEREAALNDREATIAAREKAHSDKLHHLAALAAEAE